MRTITLRYIDIFKPCSLGRKNLIHHYGEDFKYSIKQFLNLKNIPYDDKIWLVTKVVDYKVLQRWSLACARSVSHLYDDTLVNILNNVEKALDTNDSKLAQSVARSAQSAAWSAKSAAQSVAWSAARSAQSAAWSAARSSQSAAESAAWSAAWSAQSVARSAAESKQEEIIIKLLKDLL